MAVKRRLNYIVFAIVILAGIVVIYFTRARLSSSEIQDETKFVATYIALSKASGLYAEKPDSLRAAQQEAYKANGADSAWMANYAVELSGKLDKSSHIWDRIMSGIDTLKHITVSDSTAGAF